MKPSRNLMLTSYRHRHPDRVASALREIYGRPAQVWLFS
jgi:hypothetical protein